MQAIPSDKGIIALFILIVFLCSYGVSSASGPNVQVSDAGLALLIENSVTGWRTPSKTIIEGEQIYAAVLIQSFYKARNYRPAWSQNGHLMQVDTLIRAVEEAYGDGLTPDYYHLGAIKSFVGKGEGALSADPARLADMDILLTDTFLTLGCHLSGGCVNPVTIEAEWFAKHPNVDVSHVLEQALARKQIREALIGLRPSQEPYNRLKKALASYRELASKGPWPLVSTGPVLKKGLASDRVVELRKRLAASGDLDIHDSNGGDLFDEKLRQAVIIFQKRHGLKTDGSVGPATLDALNVQLKQRVRQMELNMERLRWIQGNTDQRSIFVNIANFQLDVIENGKPAFSMKVVVGKPFQRTPVFTSKMSSLILNPAWNIPDSIARKEILKKVQHNPHYLIEQKIKVLKGWGPKEEAIDPETINWSKTTGRTLMYRFRQVPGPLNPLGHIKFMFPNKFDVYLHDTSARNLFSENVRTFSHGCIRIEKPVELAEYVLRGDPHWTREQLLEALEKKTEKTVLIPHPITVNFLYLTAWVDEEGTVQFRNDVYERDDRLDEALHKKLPLQ